MYVPYVVSSGVPPFPGGEGDYSFSARRFGGVCILSVILLLLPYNFCEARRKKINQLIQSYVYVHIGFPRGRVGTVLVVSYHNPLPNTIHPVVSRSLGVSLSLSEGVPSSFSSLRLQEARKEKKRG